MAKWNENVQILKSHFPIGQPVLFESLVDGSCGWEFDAPLHIMTPFHLYREVGSTGRHSVEEALEDLLIDLDCDLIRHEDDDWWPYSGEPYLKGLLGRARKGKQRRGVNYFKTEVVVYEWGNDACGKWTIKQVKPVGD